MAEKNDKDNHFKLNDSDTGITADNLKDDEDEPLENSGACSYNGVQLPYDNPIPTLETGMKKEEHPFSFKRFLNQESVNSKHHNVSRRHYSPPDSMCSEIASSENQNYNLIVDGNSKVLNTSDMASVLPDFVQDHLVIEQCYLNGSSGTINIDSLNLHNLPDLNVEHRHVVFNVNDGQGSDSTHHSLTSGIGNLPDCASGMGQYSERCDVDNSSNNSGALPDFTVNSSERTVDGDDDYFSIRDNLSRRTAQRNCDISENNAGNRSTAIISSSPSVPLDLPLCDGAEALMSSGFAEQPIPFDLTIAAEDRDGSYRSLPTTEKVSKSLPDFLSDGPIQNDRLGENLQHGNLVSSNHDNNGQRISSDSSERFDRGRLHRELDMLRRQLSEKNRKIRMLESEIEDLRVRERRDASTLECTLHLQIEKNLKQAMERASSAESALIKTRIENSRLKAKLASLTSESIDSDIVDSPFIRSKSQKIATELRSAANAAEGSLRSLLTGIDNLRMIAASVENMQNYNEKTDELDDFNTEDSASGPAL